MASGNPGTAEPALQVRVLGHFDVRISGKPLLPLRTRTEAALLAYLVVQARRPVPRDQVAAALWPESERANTWFTEALSRLRSRLGPHRNRLRAVPVASIELDLDGVDLDLVTFERGVSANGTAELEAAAAAYGGPLLEGFADDWVAPLRAQLEDRYVGCLEELADRALQSGSPLTAVRHLRRAVATDPLNERVHTALVRALVAAGDRAAARRTRSALVQQMRAEGLEPDPAPALLDDGGNAPSPCEQAPAAPLRPHPLPSPLTGLVGRADDLSEVERDLERGRLVTLTGPGGVGKTRLAVEVAHRASDAGAVPAAFAALDALDRDDLVVPAVCAAFGHEAPPGVSPIDSLTGRIGASRALLVLDNCEHLIAASAQAASDLLSRCPNLRILSTGRQPLGVPGEIVWRVDPLPVDGPRAPGQAPGPAVALFMLRARDAGRCLAADPANVSVASAICRHLDGLPLALELAAARLRVVSLRSLEQAVAHDPGFIQADARAPGRHRSLSALIEWSYSLLEPDEREFLKCLSVFRGPFTVDAASRVFDAEGPRALRLLASLTEKSLLVPASGPGMDGGYRMLDTIRGFAADRDPDPTRLRAWQARHLEHYRACAGQAAAALNGPDEAAWQRRLEAERGNLAAALEFSLGCAATLRAGLALAAGLRPYWEMGGLTPLGRAFYDRALAVARTSGCRRCEADALLGLACVAMAQGDARARCLLEQCAAIRAEGPPSSAAAEALLHLGRVVESQGDHAGARKHVMRALEISDSLGDEAGRGASLQFLGRVAYSLGEIDETVALHQEALSVFSRLGDAYGEAIAVLNLARAAVARGRTAEGADLMQRGMTMLRRVGAARSAAVWLNIQGDMLRERGDLPAATRAYEEGLAMFRAEGNLRGSAWALTNLGNAARDGGRPHEARELATEALRLRVSICDLRGISDTLTAMGETAAIAAEAAAATDEAEQERLYERAAVLFGAAERILRTIQVPASTTRRQADNDFVQRVLARPGSRLGMQRGLEMPLDEAVEYALECKDP